MKFAKMYTIIFLLLTFSTCFGQSREAETQKLKTSILNKQNEAAIGAISKKADVNAKTEKGIPLLNIAAHHGLTDVVKAMMNNSVNPALKDKDGQSALLIASHRGHLPIVKLLTNRELGVVVIIDGRNNRRYERQANVNAVNVKGTSALHAAVAKGHNDVAQELLAKGAEVNAQKKDGSSPLMLASEQGNLPLAKLLIEQDARIDLKNKDGLTALELARRAKQQEVVDFLSVQKPKAVVDKLALTKDLLSAILKKEESKAIDAIKAGALVNGSTKSGIPLLNLAVSKGLTEVVKEMLAAEVNPSRRDRKGLDALMVAALYGKLPEAKLLTDANLEEVVKMTKEGIFRYKQGANIRAASLKGNTALLTSVAQGHLDIAEHLLAKGAWVDHQNKIGFTPLMIASEHGYLDFAAKLIEKKAKINALTAKGYSALDIATSNKHPAVVKLLITNGAKYSEAWENRVKG